MITNTKLEAIQIKSQSLISRMKHVQSILLNVFLTIRFKSHGTCFSNKDISSKGSQISRSLLLKLKFFYTRPLKRFTKN